MPNCAEGSAQARMNDHLDDKRTLRVASVQFESAPGAKEANFRKIEAFIERAARQEVRLIAFPECCITGYWHIRNLSVKALAGPDGKITRDLNPIMKMKKLKGEWKYDGDRRG